MVWPHSPPTPHPAAPDAHTTHWVTEPDYLWLSALVREVCLHVKNRNWGQGVLGTELAHLHTHACFVALGHSLPLRMNPFSQLQTLTMTPSRRQRWKCLNSQDATQMPPGPGGVHVSNDGWSSTSEGPGLVPDLSWLSFLESIKQLNQGGLNTSILQMRALRSGLSKSSTSPSPSHLHSPGFFTWLV